MLISRETGLGGNIGGDGVGPYSDPGSSGTGIFIQLSTIISNILGLLTIIAGLWFGFRLFMGAFLWLTSGGDKGKLEEARNQIIHAFIGLIIVVAAWAIISVVGLVFGLDILMNDPQALCERLAPEGTICPAAP
jgi:hypothetical protein